MHMLIDVLRGIMFLAIWLIAGGILVACISAESRTQGPKRNHPRHCLCVHCEYGNVSRRMRP